MAIIKIDGTITTSHSSVNDITDLTTTSSIAEGSNLYYTDARVQSVVDNSEVHVVIDDNGVAPRLLTRNGAASAFEFETDDQTYGGAYSATLGMISWANLPSYVVHVLAYKSTAGNLLFNLAAVGAADDGSHAMTFNLRGDHGTLRCHTSDQNTGGNLTGMTVTATDLELNTDQGQVNVTATDEFGDTTTVMSLQESGIDLNAYTRMQNQGMEIRANNYSELVNSIREPQNSNRWERSWSSLRATTNADLGNGLEQFDDYFGTDYSFSVNYSEIANFSAAVVNPDFNGDNTLGYGNGQETQVNVTMRGDGYGPGTPPLYAMRITPWENNFVVNVAVEDAANLYIKTNAPAIEENKPHVFVSLNTTERDAIVNANAGMVIFNTTDTKLQCWDGTTWNNLH